jgi:hypothetical protein
MLYVDGLPKYQVTTVIPMSDLDNGVYDGILEVRPLTDDKRTAALS